jgi:hypothetical protein
VIELLVEVSEVATGLLNIFIEQGKGKVFNLVLVNRK